VVAAVVMESEWIAVALVVGNKYVLKSIMSLYVAAMMIMDIKVMLVACNGWNGDIG
jgi:hypothetical protein